MKLERIEQLPIIRGLAILGVLAVHASSIGVVNMIESNFFVAYNFLNIFFKFGTTTFIFLSSLVLFYQYSQKDFNFSLISNFYKKRIVYIIFPYILFSIMYFLYQHFTYYSNRSFDETTSTFISQLFNGKAYYHLYFIYINIQFYILFPFLLWLAKQKPSFMKYSFVVGIAIQWAFILLNKTFWNLPNKGSLSLSYMTYFMLGACIGFYYPKFKQWLTSSSASTKYKTYNIILWGVWLIAGLAHVYIWYQARLNGTRFSTLLYEGLFNIYTICCALVLFQLACFIYNRFKSIGQILTKLGNASFGVYLIHPIILTLYWRYIPATGSSTIYHLQIAASFITILIVSWLITTVISRIPYFSIIIGQQTKRKKKEVTTSTFTS